jgi:putative acetyltransferase
VDDFVVEAERGADLAWVDDVVRRAFAPRSEVADMVAAIRASPRFRPGLALVARVGDRVAGFVMLSGTDLVDDAGRRREVLTLTPLAVAPEYERRGIGSALVRAALAEAERRGEPLVVLEGSPRYYGRLGFKPAPEYGISIDLPDWAREGAQVYLLSTYHPRIRGRVDYPAEISAITR